VKESRNNIIVGLLATFAAILAAVIGVYATHDIWSRGTNAPKRMVIEPLGVADPLVDLRTPGSGLTISVRAGEKEIRTLRLAQATIKNLGKAPILPSDFVEPLAVTTVPPWRIVAVANAHQDISGLVSLKWTKVSETEFDAQPALFNPGDQAWAAIYLANDTVEPTVPAGDPALNWKTRVVNLKGIEPAPSALDTMQRKTGWIQVYIWGWGVLFVLLSFTVYASLSLILLRRAQFLDSLKLPPFTFAITLLLLNLAASEASATYIFGVSPFVSVPINNWVNAPPIIANFGVLIAIYMIGQRRRKRVG
jgi:hypothetical protein